MQLSGGEQQRVALARAFVVEPPIVMADEPTGNLDSANGRLVLDLLLERNKRAGTTLVLVTHDAEVASRADRKIVLKDGQVVEDTLPFEAPMTRSCRAGEPWLTTSAEVNGQSRPQLETRRRHRMARPEVRAGQIRFRGAFGRNRGGRAGGRARIQRELSPHLLD